MEKSVVSIVKGTDVEALVQQAIDLVGGIGSIVKPGATVVIKPNAGHVGIPGSSVNTTPEVVRGHQRRQEGEPRHDHPGRVVGGGL